MSGKSTGQVWELELPLPKLVVMLALADRADQFGNNVYPGMSLVAWMTGYSERQVRRIVKELIDDGLLVKVKDRPGKTSVYRIDFTKGVQKSPYGEDTTPDIVMTHDTAMSPLTSQEENVRPTPDMGSAKTETNGNKDERLKEKGVEPPPPPKHSHSADLEGYNRRHDYYHAFEAGFPDNARTKVNDSKTNREHARQLFLASYSLDEVTALVQSKIAQGKSDYRFVYLMADLAQARLKRNPPVTAQPPPPKFFEASDELRAQYENGGYQRVH